MLHQTTKWIFTHQTLLLKIGFFMVFTMLIPHSTFATGTGQTMNMPGLSGLQTLRNWVTGPLPTTMGVIAIGVSCGLLAFGEMGPAAKKSLQIVLGVAGALQAPNLISLAGDTVSGLLF